MLNRVNPEFIKNIWLEFSPFRLIATPIILMVIFLLGYLIGEQDGTSFKNITTTAYSLYFILVVVFGTSKSSYSILEEVNSGTWDSQKISSISPFKLIIGKLFGATSFFWYAGLLCLLGCFSAITLININYEVGWEVNGQYLYQDMNSLLMKMLFLILSGIFAQIISMLFCLNAISSNKISANIKVQVVISQIMAIMLSLGFFLLSHGISFLEHGPITWYGTQYNFYKFSLIFLVINIFWFVAGSIRLTMKEFQYNLKPYFWILFILYCIFYSGGFKVLTAINLKFITPIILVIILTYLTLIFSPKEFENLKKIFLNFKSKNWKSLFDDIPLWLVSYVLSIAVMIYAFIEIFIKTSLTNSLILSASILSIMLFITRDILIFYYCNISNKVKNPNARPMLYLGILYMIVPAILVFVKKDLALWFIPVGFLSFNNNENFNLMLHLTLILLPALIHVSVIIFLLRKKIQKCC